MVLREQPLNKDNMIIEAESYRMSASMYSSYIGSMSYQRVIIYTNINRKRCKIWLPQTTKEN